MEHIYIYIYIYFPAVDVSCVGANVPMTMDATFATQTNVCAGSNLPADTSRAQTNFAGWCFLGQSMFDFVLKQFLARR